MKTLLDACRNSLPLCLGLGLVALGSRWSPAPAQQTPSEVLELRELRIVDGNGRAVLVLAADAQGQGFLEMGNAQGVPVVFLGASEGRGALDLLNAQGQRIVFAGGSPREDGGLRVESHDGQRAFYLGDDVRGNGRVPDTALPGARVRD